MPPPLHSPNTVLGQPFHRALPRFLQQVPIQGLLVPHHCHGDHAKSQPGSHLSSKLKSLPGFSFTSGQMCMVITGPSQWSLWQPPSPFTHCFLPSCPAFQEDRTPGISRKRKQFPQPGMRKLRSDASSSVEVPWRSGSAPPPHPLSPFSVPCPVLNA